MSMMDGMAGDVRVSFVEKNVVDRVSELRIAIFTQQISNYHVARYRAASEFLSKLTVISVMNSADFADFLASDDSVSGLEVVRIFDGESAYAQSVANGSAWEKVGRVLDEVQPDVIAVAGWSFAESLAAIAWARSNGRAVLLMSASQARDGVRTDWREAVKRRVVKACDAALVGGALQKAYVVALGLAEEKVFFGYNAVDNEHFIVGADAARANIGGDCPVDGLPERYLLASGRFIAKKNFPRLVQAFGAALERVDHGHHLVVLGDGPERGMIEAEIVAHGLAERVHLPGYIGYDLLPVFYGLSEGFLHVSLNEQWGLVVNEAAAAGLPLVVSSPCGSARALVHEGKNGWIVNPYDVEDMTHAIAALISVSSAKRAMMGKVSREIVKEWGPSRFALGLLRGVQTAFGAPRRQLGVVDRALFRAIARLRISTVA